MPQAAQHETVDTAALEEAFAYAEASLLLEGMDPTRSERYRDLRAQVIAGEVSFEDAMKATVECHHALAAERNRVTVPA